MLLDELRHITFEYLTKKRDSDLIDSYIFTITDKLHQLKLINELLDETNNPKSLRGILKDIQKSIKHTKIYIKEKLELRKNQEELDGLSRESTEEQIKLTVVKIIEKELYYIRNVVYKDEIVGIWIGDEQYMKHFLGDSIESLYFNEVTNTLELTISLSNIENTYFNPIASIIRPCIENNIKIPNILFKLENEKFCGVNK